MTGAHTIGMARCVNFRGRVYGDFPFSLSQASDTHLNNIKTICPAVDDGHSNNNESAMDYVTPNLFDNSYYHLLLKKEGLMNSDQALYSSFLPVGTSKLVEKYAADPAAFFNQFAESMVKMGNITNQETYSNGEVRKNCRFVNT